MKKESKLTKCYLKIFCQVAKKSYFAISNFNFLLCEIWKRSIKKTCSIYYKFTLLTPQPEHIHQVMHKTESVFF